MRVIRSPAGHIRIPAQPAKENRAGNVMFIKTFMIVKKLKSQLKILRGKNDLHLQEKIS